MRNTGLWFLSQRRPRPWRRDMAALGSISADVRHKAAPPAPHRGPPALGAPWGHAPPVWCHTGAHNTPDWTHDSAPGWRRSWGLGVCGSSPGAFQVEVGQLRARVRVPGSPWVVWGAWGSSRAALWQCFRSCQLNPPTGCARGHKQAKCSESDIGVLTAGFVSQ